MKRKTFKISIERTVQIKQFEPVKIKLETICDIEKGEVIRSQIKKEYKYLEKQCNSMITEQIRKYRFK